MEKFIKYIKVTYYLMTTSGAVYFTLFFYKASREEAVTVSSLVSALIIIALLFGAVSFFFMLIIGILRRTSAKGDYSKINSSKNNILTSVVGMFLVFLIWAVINLIDLFFGVSIPAFTFNHFRTNIITGQCSYGGFSTNVENDPWYYKPGCKVEQKIKVAEIEGFYESRVDECKQYCNNLRKNYFCNTYIITVGNAWGSGPENLLCTEIVDCPQINCAEHEKDIQSQQKEGI